VYGTVSEVDVEVLVEVDVEVLVEEVVPVDVPRAVGANVATKGVCMGVGNTTGTPSTVSATPSAPSSSVTTPVARTPCFPPACSVPVHKVAPVAADLASTQHGPDAVSDS
jgi:hypothetical protein